MGTWIPDLFDLEKKLFQKLTLEKRSPPIIIAIGGFSGTGKDTLSLKLMERIEKDLGIRYEKYNAGDFIRKIAVEEGFPPAELDRFIDKIKDSREYSDNSDS